MQEVLRCTKKEEQEKTTTLHKKAEKDLLKVHEKRIDFLLTAEEFELKVHSNARKMHEAFSAKNDEIKILKDKVSHHEHKNNSLEFSIESKAEKRENGTERRAR